jgi:hypothetical protein
MGSRAAVRQRRVRGTRLCREIFHELPGAFDQRSSLLLTVAATRPTIAFDAIRRGLTPHGPDVGE